MEQIKRRVPVVAFLLSLAWPGLGHVYDGDLRKGIPFFVIFWLLWLVVLLAVPAFSFWGLICSVAIVPIYVFLVAAHAAVQAARLKAANLKWYNKWYVYVCIMLLVRIAVERPLLFIQHELAGWRCYIVPVESMAPALISGDCFVAKLRPYETSLPQRGDIIIFPFPEDKSKSFVKSVVGLPGEHIQIRDKAVFINDRRLDDPWASHLHTLILSRDKSERDNFGPVSIPKEEIFVLGDNRDISQDSRLFGNVQIKDVEGKALFVYWANHWNRIGKEIR